MKYSLAFLAAVVPAFAAEQCGPLHYVYARATTEPPQGVDFTGENSASAFETKAAQTWSKGYGAAGASLFSNISAALPGSIGYPVHYPASAGNSMPVGVKDMLAYLSKISQACPNAKFALGGHSQGGMVTVQVIPQIPKDILAKVVAVAMFGSPPCPAAVKDRCNSYCNKGDFVCDRSGGASKGSGGAGLPKAGAGTGLKGAGGSGAPDLSAILQGFKGAGGAAPASSAAPVAPAAAPAAPAKDMGGMAGHGHGGMVARLANADDCAFEDKWVAKSPKNAHLAYSEDGYYIKKATCFVMAQYKKLGGAA